MKKTKQELLHDIRNKLTPFWNLPDLLTIGDPPPEVYNIINPSEEIARLITSLINACKTNRPLIKEILDELENE